MTLSQLSYYLEPTSGGNRRKPIEYYVNDNGCWICVSHECGDPLKRTQVYRNGRKQLTHRYIYELENGPIDKGLVVRHKCDNPTCINPQHLETGTQADNIQDMVERKRVSVGEQRKNTKLTTEQVIAIWYDSRPLEVIAKDYGVSFLPIFKIKHRQSWRHVTEDLV